MEKIEGRSKIITKGRVLPRSTPGSRHRLGPLEHASAADGPGGPPERVTRHRKLVWMVFTGGGLLALALIGFALVPVTREVLRTTAPRTATDTERLGGARMIGQSFVAPADRISEIWVFLKPPAPPETFPILFHLRHGRYATGDVRTVTLSPADVSSDGVLRIRFLPVERSGGRTYAFVLEAPHARKGLSLYRQVDGSIFDQGYLFWADRDEDRPGDLEFAVSARQPRLRALWERVLPGLATSAGARQALRRSLIVGAVFAVALGMLLRRAEQLSRRQVGWLLGGLVVVHVLLHLPFVFFYPGVNDEGSYLMDIQGLRNGIIPFRDALAKGPLFLVFLAPIGLWFPHTLFPARLLVASASALEVVLLYHLGRSLGDFPDHSSAKAGRSVGLLAAALWALSPAAITQTSQLFLQALSLPLVTLAFLMLLRGHGEWGKGHGESPTDNRQPNTSGPFWTGVILGCAYLIRASSLAFLLPAALLALLPLRPLALSFRRLGFLLLGFVMILASTAALAYPFLGFEATAVMLSLEAFIIGAARAGAGSVDGVSILPPREILERLAAFGATLFRTGLGLLLVWAAFVAASVARLFKLPRATGAALFLGILLPLLARIVPLNFGLAGVIASLGSALQLLAGTLLLSLVFFIGWKRRHEQEPGTAVLPAFLITGIAWLSLALLYSFFGRFRQQYHAEFLPLYVLGSAVLLAPPLAAPAVLRPRRIAAALILVLVGAFSALGYTIARAQPHAGSIPHRTAREVGRILRRHSNPGEEILTAQGLFTFYADRQILFGAAHPGWYLEERVGTVPADLRRRFLPDKDVVRAAVRDRVRLVAIDRRTREVYFLYDTEMRALLDQRFALLATVHSPFEEDPVEIWMRTEQ